MNRSMNKFNRKRIPAVILTVMLLLSTMPFTLSASASTPLKKHVNIGYWLGGNGGTNRTLAQANPGWDVIIVSFIETQGNYYTPHLNMDLSNVYSGTPAQQTAAFKADIKTLQAQGRKVLISCGGQNGVVHFDNNHQRDVFLNGVKAIINEYGFDGFDVDFEGSSIACMAPDRMGNLVTAQSINLEYILRNLKATYGSNFLITAAPEYIYVQGGAIASGMAGAFLPFLDSIRDILDFIHPQYYNGFNGDFAWLQPSANAGPPFAQVYSEEGYIRLSQMLITGFVTMDKGTFVGLRPDQVAFGVPARAGAGNGIQPPSVYASALNKLITQYPTFRGIMTWSIGWDESGGNNFVNAIAPVIAAANNNSGQPLVNAQTPNITSQPSDRTVNVNGTAALTVAANVSRGTLSYQWFQNTSKTNTGGTAISGATSATYNAPTSTTGTRYYYCIVTNTDNAATGNKTATATSNAVSVVVNTNSQTNAAAPNITGQPSDRTVNIGGTAALTVTANVSQGTLSYQWFQNTSKTNTGGTAISGATSATYNAPTNTAGTSYYYCVVTNTDNAATGNKTATAVSNAVSVVVSNNQTLPPEWVQPFGGHDAYSIGDEVSYNGQVWVSNINGNVWAPGVFGWSLK